MPASSCSRIWYAAFWRLASMDRYTSFPALGSFPLTVSITLPTLLTYSLTSPFFPWRELSSVCSSPDLPMVSIREYSSCSSLLNAIVFFLGNLPSVADDIGKAFQIAIKDLYDHGCRYLQIDDTSWTYMIDDNFLLKVSSLGYKKKIF